MTDFSRLFFALWPDDQTRLKLAHLNQVIVAKGFKPVQPQNFHITLVFLGKVDKATALSIEESVADISISPVALTFDRLSYWSRPKIICLTCSQFDDELNRLVAALTAKVEVCGLQTDTRPYQPHITLARHAQYLPDLNFEPIVWQANSFCLVESCSEPDGVNYKLKHNYPHPS